MMTNTRCVTHSEKLGEIVIGMNEIDTWVLWFAGIIAVLFVGLLLFGVTAFINDFSRELKHLNNEISRTTGRERRYWIRQKRSLWRSLIPFVED